MPSPGDSFGKYRILRRLGRGGMAEVYEAEQRVGEGLVKRLALKLLINDVDPDPDTVRGLIDEATLVARLAHPNIVEVFDFGEHEGTLYIAMELIDGWDLRRVLRRCARHEVLLPVAASAYLVREVAQALDYIHGRRQPVIHRDISPHNVFVTRDGHVKLGDFGIAKTSARLAQTLSGQLKGKLAYVAPEQTVGEEASPRSDIYATGLLLFELLTGRRLLQGDNELQLLRLAQTPPSIPPSSLNPQAAPLDALVRRTLERHPTMRLPSAALLAQQLEQLLHDTPCTARSLTTLLRQLDSDGTQVSDTATSSLQLQPRPRTTPETSSGGEELTTRRTVVLEPAAGQAQPRPVGSAPALPASAPVLPDTAPVRLDAAPALPDTAPALPPELEAETKRRRERTPPSEAPRTRGRLQLAIAAALVVPLALLAGYLAARTPDRGDDPTALAQLGADSSTLTVAARSPTPDAAGALEASARDASAFDAASAFDTASARDTAVPRPRPRRPRPQRRRPRQRSPRVVVVPVAPPPRSATKPPPTRQPVTRATARRKLAELEAALARARLPAAKKRRIEAAAGRILRLILGGQPEQAVRLIERQMRALERR
jgi:serine/threonine protein kinase